MWKLNNKTRKIFSKISFKIHFVNQISSLKLKNAHQRGGGVPPPGPPALILLKPPKTWTLPPPRTETLAAARATLHNYLSAEILAEQLTIYTIICLIHIFRIIIMKWLGKNQLYQQMPEIFCNLIIIWAKTAKLFWFQKGSLISAQGHY